MTKKLLFILTIIALVVGSLQAQELTFKPHGINPRQVAENDQDFFDRTSSGLHNVGVESQVYLLVKFDGQLDSPVFNILASPSSSAAVFGDQHEIDTSNVLVKFIPDLVGTYKLEVVSNGLADTVTLNAALYLGVESAGANCATCHSESFNHWQGTGHATTLEEELNGDGSSHFQAYCMKCHSTGYDADADNNGFDDFGFVFPDSLYPGGFDDAVAAYPDAMKRSDVQCESCHGPGSAHIGQTGDYKIETTLSSDNCAECHNSGTHHVIAEQWDFSIHGSESHLYTDRASCTPCHNGKGFVDYIKGNEQDAPEKVAITCATCHDPHSHGEENQLRTVAAELANGTVVDLGKGGLCANCHKARRDGVEYTNDYLNNISSHFGPHHGPQTDVLLGDNFPTFGQTISNSPHKFALTDGCVTCHMYPNEVDDNNQVLLSGNHSFSMVDENGIDNVKACETCHGTITSFDEIEYELNGTTDLDGDGTSEGLPEEVHGLLDKLAELLPPYGSTDINNIDSTWTLAEAQGFYNHHGIEEDRSGGFHNPDFAIGLLYASIEALGGTVDVDASGILQPAVFALEQNYPNPFNPSTRIDFSIPERANVTITVYDAIGREVAELLNETKEAGTYNLNWDASSFSTGVYFYKLTSGNHVATKKMLLIK